MLQRLQSRRLPSLLQLKYLPRLLNSREQKVIALNVVIACAAFIVLLIRLWLYITVPIPAIGGSYTEGLVGAPHFINPLLAPGNHVDRDLSSLVFSGLMRVTTDGSLIPVLLVKAFFGLFAKYNFKVIYCLI